MTTIPDEPVPVTPRLHKQAGAAALNIILVVLTVAMLVPPFHCVGGMLLLTSCGVHVALHGNWIKAVILGAPKNNPPSLQRQRRLFWAKLISGVLCGLSGLVIGMGSLPAALEPHFFLPLECCGTPLHVVSGLTFGSLNIAHLVVHRNWFRKELLSSQTQFLRRDRPGSQPDGHGQG
jgi:hypothetical protein